MLKQTEKQINAEILSLINDHGPFPYYLLVQFIHWKYGDSILHLEYLKNKKQIIINEKDIVISNI
jgi:hypothetical protein